MSEHQNPNNPGPQAPIPVEVVVPEALIPGEYANALAVWSSRHEFTFDFLSMQPPVAAQTEEEPPVRNVAHVVARVKIAPTVMMSLLQAISTHMSAYEAQHGPIPGGAGPVDVPPMS